ncbi:MAG: outer membrane beta-barrel protein [Cyclobacteriaceae bacterium]|nr:outer membrane beta-barrel protein [Cyclobacteriaceae bacterium]
MISLNKGCKSVLVYTFFLLVVSTPLMATQNEDSLAQEPSKFKFGVHLSGSMNYFNYGDLQAFDVASDYTWGGSIGFSFDWKFTNYYHLRFEPYYEYQQLANKYKDELNSLDITFTNHNAGFNFFPLVFSVGNKVQPEISVGGYLNYIVSANYKTSLNGQPVENIEYDTNNLQYGLTFGAGLYLGRKLIEVRFKKSFTDYVVTESQKNSINQVKFVIVL